MAIQFRFAECFLGALVAGEEHNVFMVNLWEGGKVTLLFIFQFLEVHKSM